MTEINFKRTMNEIFKSMLNPIGDMIHFEQEGLLLIDPDYTDRIISFQEVSPSSRDIYPQLWNIELQIIETTALQTDTALDFYINRILGFVQISSLVDLIGFAICEKEKRVQMLLANDLVITTKTVGKYTEWREKITTHFPNLTFVGENMNFL